MKKRIISAVLIAVVTLAVSSCSIINSILQQADELANLANCEYSLKNVSNLTIAGVNVNPYLTDIIFLLPNLLAFYKVPHYYHIPVIQDNYIYLI